MKALEAAARYLLGGIFLVFGLDYLVHFMPELPFSEAGGQFLEALINTGYMFPLIKLVEVTGAILLMTPRFAPLGALLVAPIVLNIGLYHLVLDPNGGVIGAALVICEAFLLWTYRQAYQPLVMPGTASGAPLSAATPRTVEPALHASR